MLDVTNFSIKKQLDLNSHRVLSSLKKSNSVNVFFACVYEDFTYRESAVYLFNHDLENEENFIFNLHI